MSFPLSDWIDDHSGVPHNMGPSGMRGELQSTKRWLRSSADGQPEALRRSLAQRNGVPERRLFLTHGASEGNSLVMFYLRDRAASRNLRRPRCRVLLPEYPPLGDVARWAGFRLNHGRSPADLTVLSNPHNPSGEWRNPAEVRERAGRSTAILVDETFREFSGRDSLAHAGVANLWTTGTFTKVWGADDVRVGWVIAPSAEAEGFAEFHGVVADGLATRSVGAAQSLLAHGREILSESRGIVRANVAALRAAIPELPPLAAPLWFDRVKPGLDGDRFSRDCLAAGVLVSPGSYFGDRHGVRLGLTRRSFPRDLPAYLAVRARAQNRRRPPARGS